MHPSIFLFHPILDCLHALWLPVSKRILQSGFPRLCAEPSSATSLDPKAEHPQSGRMQASFRISAARQRETLVSTAGLDPGDLLCVPGKSFPSLGLFSHLNQGGGGKKQLGPPTPWLEGATWQTRPL